MAARTAVVAAAKVAAAAGTRAMAVTPAAGTRAWTVGSVRGLTAAATTPSASAAGHTPTGATERAGPAAFAVAGAAAGPAPMMAVEDEARAELEQAKALRTSGGSSAKVARLLEKAAHLGNADAMYELGMLYAEEAVPDPLQTRAKSLLLAAAALGHAEAQYRVALYHRDVRPGRVHGIPRDDDASVRFLELAAQQRHPAACFLLAVIALSGTRGSRDPTRAYQLLVAAAEEGHTPSMCLAAALLHKDPHSAQWTRDPDAEAEELLAAALRTDDAYAIPVAAAWRAHLRDVRGTSSSEPPSSSTNLPSAPSTV